MLFLYYIYMEKVMTILMVGLILGKYDVYYSGPMKTMLDILIFYFILQSSFLQASETDKREFDLSKSSITQKTFTAHSHLQIQKNYLLLSKIPVPSLFNVSLVLNVFANVHAEEQRALAEAYVHAFQDWVIKTGQGQSTEAISEKTLRLIDEWESKRKTEQGQLSEREQRIFSMLREASSIKVTEPAARLTENDIQLLCCLGLLHVDAIFLFINDFYFEYQDLVGNLVKTSKNNEEIQRWKNAWNTKLEESRLQWVFNQDLGLMYNPSVAIAYDPKEIKTKRVGPFVYFEIPDMPNRRSRRIHRESCIRSDFLDVLEEDTIMDDSINSILVVTRRWPRVTYDSLLISKEWKPQKLIRDLIRSQLKWASRNAILCFHRGNRFVDHQHSHLYPVGSFPIAELAGSFISSTCLHGLEIGSLSNYPVHHIAFSSSNAENLEEATLTMSEFLEEKQIRFHQLVFYHPLIKKIMVCFVFWKDVRDYPLPFTFETPGAITVEVPTDLSEETIRHHLKAISVPQETVDRIRDEFLERRWRRVIPGRQDVPLSFEFFEEAA